jgi:hypothetical protein
MGLLTNGFSRVVLARARFRWTHLVIPRLATIMTRFCDHDAGGADRPDCDPGWDSIAFKLINHAAIIPFEMNSSDA